MNKLMRRFFSFFLFLLILTGCGYQFGFGDLSARYSTITVPYIEGDFDGSLTSVVIGEISRSGSFRYQRDCGDLMLNVKIIDLSDTNIGFRYDRKKKGELTKSIIPTETRITVVAEVNLQETSTGCILLGPVRLSASVDFDHDYYSSRNGINIFSLGQLSDIDAAYDAVRMPLNEILARKIVELISES